MVAKARIVVWLSFLLFACQVKAFHLPAKMNKTIQNLLHHYNITKDDIFDGKPVFSKDSLSGAMEVNAMRVYMGAVLQTYEKMIGQMLSQLPNPSPLTTVTNDKAPAGTGTEGDVRTDLSYILKMVTDLKKHHYREQEHLLTGLHELRKIQVNNTVIQSKALWELQRLYKDASKLPNNGNATEMRRRRGRRHAHGLKTRPRG